MNRADAGVELLLTDDEARATEIAGELDDANVHAPARRDADPLRGRGAGRRRRRAARVRAGRAGLASGRDRHRRLAPRRAPPPAGADGRARRRAGHRLGSLDPVLRPARGPRRLRGAPDPSRRPPRRRRLHGRGRERRRAARRVHRARRRDAAARRTSFPPSASTPSSRSRRRGSRSPRSSGGSRRSAIGNPRPVLLVPGARMADARTMGEGKHVRFTVASGAGRASAVAFGRPRLPDGHEDGLDAAFSLEVNRWNGAEEARLVLLAAAPPQAAADRALGQPPATAGSARPSASCDAPLEAAPRHAGGASGARPRPPRLRHRRHRHGTRRQRRAGARRHRLRPAPRAASAGAARRVRALLLGRTGARGRSRR